MELLCSIVLVSDDQISKGLKGLDNLAKSAGDPDKGLI